MQKVWKYFKLFVLVWGFIWLAIVLFIGATILVQKMSNKQEARQQQEEQVDTRFKKTVGDINIKVAKDPADSEKLLVSVSRKNTPLVTDYELPLKQFDLSWIDVDDARVYSMGEKGYRIILFSSESESDHDYSHNYIWLLTLNGAMRFDTMIDLSNAHKIPGSESQLFGNRVIQLPAFDDVDYDQIEIPVEVEVERTLGMRPMLSQPNLELLKQHYNKMIQDRIAKLTKSKDADVLEKYRAASQEFEKTVLGKEIGN